MRPVRSYRRRIATLVLLALAACTGTAGTEPPITPVEDPDLVDARMAWTYVENNTLPSTGLANAVDGFKYVTVWDIASLIGAVYSAHELGLVRDVEYDGRIRQILGTLERMPLFDGAAFNKFYDGTTGQMADRSFKETTTARSSPSPPVLKTNPSPFSKPVKSPPANSCPGVPTIPLWSGWRHRTVTTSSRSTNPGRASRPFTTFRKGRCSNGKSQAISSAAASAGTSCRRQ